MSPDIARITIPNSSTVHPPKPSPEVFAVRFHIQKHCAVYLISQTPSQRSGDGLYDFSVVARMGLKRAKRLGEVGARGGGKDSAPRISTPGPFRDLLISIARSAKHINGDVERPVKP